MRFLYLFIIMFLLIFGAVMTARLIYQLLFVRPGRAELHIRCSGDVVAAIQLLRQGGFRGKIIVVQETCEDVSCDDIVCIAKENDICEIGNAGADDDQRHS